jgi:hypothetical protein
MSDPIYVIAKFDSRDESCIGWWPQPLYISAKETVIRLAKNMPLDEGEYYEVHAITSPANKNLADVVRIVWTSEIGT